MSISSPTEALKASKVIVSHEPLSAIPPVEKIRDSYNSSKLKEIYRYDIPVVILDVKHWYDSASGLIVFTDFSSINTRSSFAGGKVPYSVAVATYGIDRHQLPSSILFNSSISTAQYENLILEMEKSEPLSKDGFVIARLSFDLKISCRKYLEGYFSGIELVDSQNISQVFEKLEFQFSNMLYRMKQFVSHNTYNELRETYKFGSYEIKTRDKEKNNIEMESQLRDHKRLCLKNSSDTSSGASKLLFNRMAPDSQMANFDSQSTQKPAHELLSSDFYFESMPTMTASRHEGMLTPNSDSEDKSQNVTAQDKSPLSIKNIQMPPPKTPLRPVVRSSGAALLFRPMATDSQSPIKQPQTGGQLLVPQTQSQDQHRIEQNEFTSIDETSIVSPDEFTVDPNWNEATQSFLQRANRNLDITIKELHELKSFDSNVTYNLTSVKLNGILYIDSWKVTPYQQNTKLAPIKLMIKDANNPGSIIDLEVGNDDELASFYGFLDSEIDPSQYKKIKSMIKQLLSLKDKTITIKVSRKIRRSPTNISYAYWTCNSCVQSLLNQ
ncbi:hypothetical protein K6H11_002296 [Candida tropicalis]